MFFFVIIISTVFDKRNAYYFTEWIPQEVIDKCKLIIEFCCARKEIGGVSHKDNILKSSIEDAYLWCGQIRQVIKPQEIQSSGKSGIHHKARLTFIEPDNFVVSACGRLVGREEGSEVQEEIWWAPRAYQVRTTKPN